MVCDYYLIKKRKLDVDQLYTDRGIYWYNGGWNWRAYASFIIGFAPLLPGFAKSIDHSLDVGGAWKVRKPFTRSNWMNADNTADLYLRLDLRLLHLDVGALHYLHIYLSAGSVHGRGRSVSSAEGRRGCVRH